MKKMEYEFKFNGKMNYFINAISKESAEKEFRTIFPNAENVTVKAIREISEVYRCALVAREKVFEGSEKDCNEFCEIHNWVLIDENDFKWDLEIDD